MTIQHLFEKPVDRPIDGVIKADDARNLRNELEEYVFTAEVSKSLIDFSERYVGDLAANGVWISGFFGSGKSHLLKMLSLLLDATLLEDGTRPADLLLSKIDDEILRADLQKCADVPARSVLFNIDQKFDGIGGDHTAPILEVFVKVLNDLQGYYGKQGYVAEFERDLDRRGDLEPFKETYLRLTGTPWETGREALATVSRGDFARAYAEHFGVPQADALGAIKRAKDDYRLSIEGFAKMVREYIDQQPPGFRLNFFVDEVGQFIGQDSKLMLNLQTVAETLGTVCEGRAWLFVTSQADLEGVLGGFRDMQADDVSKILGRFKTRPTLTSSAVEEVIQKRLLAKREPEPEALTVLYDAEHENLDTLFSFGDQSRKFKGWRGSDAFCDLYPFHPYQFDLFQVAIEQLSKHNAFTGKYTSVGERSMLEVFQEATKTLLDEEVGRLATFDRLYDGIAATIRGDMQTSIGHAAKQLGEGTPLRILKALFLLKWVREFKATPRNVAILLIDRLDLNLEAHQKEVTQALALLESRAYLQRNGDAYEYLTDVEKDVEVEIRNTEIDDSQVLDLLGKTLFDDVLRNPKIRYDANGHDYLYAKKLDDQIVIGKDAELAVNLVTTDHPNHGDPTTLASQNMGKSELLAVLPGNDTLIQQARLYLKTVKYIRQNSGGTDTTRQSILDQRGQQNSQRRRDLQTLAGNLLRQAPLYLNGSLLDSVGAGDPRNRFAKAEQELVSFAYPSLKMLKGAFSEATLRKALLEPDDLLAGGAVAPSEAEQEVLLYVTKNQNNGERTSVEEIVRHFGKKPYGWYPLATLTFVGRLLRMGKIEVRGPDPLDPAAAFERLANTRQHGGLRVRLQEQFDAASVNALKTFHHDLFDRANAGADARTVGEATAEALRAEAQVLEGLLDQATRYPFLDALRSTAVTVKTLAEKSPGYLVKNLAVYEADLLDAKDDVVAPIKAFMHGAQREAYDEAIAFLKEEAANLDELDASAVQPLRDLEASPHPYRGALVPNAKAAVTSLRTAIDEKLAEARNAALAAIDEHEARLKAVPEFEALDADDQAQVLKTSQAARSDIEAARFVSGIRDRRRRYVDVEYAAQLATASRLAAAAQPRTPTSIDEPPAPAVEYVPSARLRPACALPYVSTEAELDEWLAALRTAAKAELDKGNRISL